MTQPTQRQINLYRTPTHQCSYLPDRTDAAAVFIEPDCQKDQSLYSLVSAQGFRRSGEHLYRPHCPDCQACIAVRLAVNDFNPRRQQRRIWKKNQDLQIQAYHAKHTEEYQALYKRYIEARHADGDMNNQQSIDQYLEFLQSSWSETIFYEFRDAQQQLLAVAVVDHLQDALSAVYTFFDPDFDKRSLGTYAVLWQIEIARRLNLDWLYLGYWIADCRKMNYKTDYQPLQYYYQDAWHQQPA